MVPAFHQAMAELKTVKKGQIEQLPLYAEPKDWLCFENDMVMKIKNGVPLEPVSSRHRELGIRRHNRALQILASMRRRRTNLSL
jgi:hypothetical protein